MIEMVRSRNHLYNFSVQVCRSLVCSISSLVIVVYDSYQNYIMVVCANNLIIHLCAGLLFSNPFTC